MNKIFQKESKHKINKNKKQSFNNGNSLNEGKFRLLNEYLYTSDS